MTATLLTVLGSRTTLVARRREPWCPKGVRRRASARSAPRRSAVVAAADDRGPPPHRARESAAERTAAEVAEILEPLDLGDDPELLEQWMTSWEALPARVKLLITAFISFVICNMDKVNMSVAIIPMAREFGWNATVSGLVQSAFFYGYMICQLPGGYLSTRFSGSRMLPIGVGLWSAATFALPAVGGSIPGLCVSRSFVGLGEAMAPAAVADVIARMSPPEERSRSVSFVNSGLYLGTILGLLTSPLLIDAFGWQSVFYVFGGIGLVWVIGWEALVRGLKSTDNDFFEKIRITRQDTSSTKTGSIPWRAMLRCTPVRALMYTHFCSGWFHFSILSWLPSYFSTTLGLELGDAARISLIPPVAGIIISSVAGPAADALIARGWQVGLVRKLSQCIAFVGPSMCLVGASLTDSSDLKIALITGAIGIGSFCLPGLYSNPQDLSPKYAGFVHSMTTTLAAVPGIIGVPVTGAILDATNSWPLALFAPSVIVMLSGAYVFGVYGRGHEVHFTDNRPFEFEKYLNLKALN